MYYRVRSITTENNTVYLTVSASDVAKRMWFKSTLEGMEDKPLKKQYEEVGKELYDGVLQFPKGVRCKAKRAYDSCKRRHGTWRSNYHREDEKKLRARFAHDFARRMCA